MKKNTIETMIAYLNGADVNTAALRDELQGELDHLTAKARANADKYAAAAPIVLAAMSDKHMTAKEIYAACAADLPDDFTQNKVQYLLLHQLADKVKRNVIGRGASTYCL